VILLSSEKDLWYFGAHAASPASDDRRSMYAFADVFSTVALGR